QAEDGIRDFHVTGVQTCALPIYRADAAVAAGQQALDDAGLAVVVAEADGAAVLLVAADLVAQLAEAFVGLLGGELRGPLEGGVRSEERRVGKEGRGRGALHQGTW